MIIVAVLVLYVTYLTGFTIGRSGNVRVAEEQTPLITEINFLREENKLNRLSPDPTLDATALVKAQDMAEKNYFEHDAPDGTPWSDFIYKNRPGSVSFAENIAHCYPTNHDTFVGWVNSPSHYKNMIDPDWTLYGTATVYDEDQRCYISVNHFAK